MKAFARLLLFGGLFHVTAFAQLALFSFDGTVETPVGATYNYGGVAVGSNRDTRFRVHNTGTSPVTISTLNVSGSGFSIAAVNGSLPYPIAPANFLEFSIRFNGTTPATYSANLQVNSLSVILLATAALPPQLPSVSGCAVNAQGNFDFGNVQIGTQHPCTFSLYNPTGQPMLISIIGLTGAFQFLQTPVTPLTLAANQTIPITIAITPVCGTVSYTGSLIINSSQTSQAFVLTASGITPALSKPSLTFDSNSFASGEQHSLTLSLPTVFPCAAIGNLNLTFTPNVSSVADDKAVLFMQGNTRSLQFSVQPNSSAITVGGQPLATFQTGTTAGTITFTLAGLPLAANPATVITISPAIVAIDTATASNQRTGELDVEVIGFDNTYSAGQMSFTFFDTSGTQVGSPISADFTSQFKSYFAAQTSGSSFLMRVSFPVIGDQTKIGRVQATMTNSAGPSQTGPLTFQ